MSTCLECKFRDTIMAGDEPKLECHRYPPQIISIDGEVYVAWPQIDSDDFCGEFDKRPDGRFTAI